MQIKNGPQPLLLRLSTTCLVKQKEIHRSPTKMETTTLPTQTLRLINEMVMPKMEITTTTTKIPMAKVLAMATEMVVPTITKQTTTIPGMETETIHNAFKLLMFVPCLDTKDTHGETAIRMLVIPTGTTDLPTTTIPHHPRYDHHWVRTKRPWRHCPNNNNPIRFIG